MTGLVSSGAGFGMLIVPPSAARLIEQNDWRYSFVVLGLIILVVVLVASQFLRRDPSKMGTVAYGEKPQTHAGPSTPVAGYTFKEAIKTSQFWIIFVMIFWYGVYSMSYNVHIVPDAINSGMTSTAAAGILSASGGLLILGRVILGNLADKIGNKPIFILGFILSTIALLSISFSQSHWVFFLLAVLIGFSQGGLGTSQSPIVASLFGLKNHGLIFGCIGFGFTIGAAIGPYFTGLIFDATGSYHIAFLVCAGTSIAAIFFALMIKPIKGAAVRTMNL
jgi:MFS family permease